MMKRFYISLGLTIFAFLLPPTVQAENSVQDFQFRNGLFTIKAHNLELTRILDEVSRVSGATIYLFERAQFAPVRCGLEALPMEEVLRSLLRGCSYAVVHHGTEATRAAEGEGRWVRPGVFIDFSNSARGKKTMLAERRAAEDSHRLEVSAEAPVNSPEEYASAEELEEEDADASFPAAEPSSEESSAVESEDQDQGGAGENAQGGSPSDPVKGQDEDQGYNSEPEVGGHEVAADRSDENSHQPLERTAIPPQVLDSPLFNREAWLKGQMAEVESRIRSGVSDAEYDFWSENVGAEFVTHDEQLRELYAKKLENLGGY